MLLHRCASLLLCIVLGAFAQAPAFEVFSLKPSPSAAPVQLGRPSPGRVQATHYSLKGLITEAYGVKSFQIIDAPGWASDDPYDIQAQYNSIPGEPIEAEWRRIDSQLRTALEYRFGLRVRTETRNLPVYVLKPAAGNTKIQPSHCVERSGPDTVKNNFCGSRYGNKGFNRTLDWTGVTLAEFVRWALPNVLNRPVLDNTGIAGRVDIHLEWTPDQATAGPTGGAPAAPEDATQISIFRAVEEQLGLKLEASRAPVEALVIESVHRPTAN